MKDRAPNTARPAVGIAGRPGLAVTGQLGLARGEGWVWPLVAELVFTHRSYGALPIAEYDAFIDMTVDAVAPVIHSDLFSRAAAIEGDAVTFEIAASATDGGTLSYQWYVNKTDAASGGTARRAESIRR